MAVDLHIHTTASDGTLSPEQVVAEASAAGLTAIAIADHDTVAGVRPALDAAADLSLEVFPAVEVSSLHGSGEAHILGYFVDLEHPELGAELARIRDDRRRRGEEIVRRLQTMGVPITLQDVAAHSQGESVGRPHVASALVGLGIVSEPQEAFRRYLRRGRPAYVPRYRPPVEESIRLVRAAGGLAVLAHPGIMDRDGTIPQLVAAGLGGLEAYHTEHTPAHTQRYLEMAASLGLIVTGGTDSHGPNGPTPVAIGQLYVPDQCAQALIQWARDHGRWRGR